MRRSAASPRRDTLSLWKPPIPRRRLRPRPTSRARSCPRHRGPTSPGPTRRKRTTTPPRHPQAQYGGSSSSRGGSAWHLFVFAAFWGMLWLGDWQYHRAMDGNGLSWAYTFEWPLFAVFGVVFWARTIRDEFHLRRGGVTEAELVARAMAQSMATLPKGAMLPAGELPDGVVVRLMRAARRRGGRPRARQLQRLPGEAERRGQGPQQVAARAPLLRADRKDPRRCARPLCVTG